MGKGVCYAKEERENKDCFAKDDRGEVYKQYSDEVAPNAPSPLLTQRDQVLLRHFSHEQMSTVQQENETKGDRASLERA